MKIIVPVKIVAALDEEFELTDDSHEVDPDFIEWDLNEWDTFALESALQLREEFEEGEVIVVTVGDDESDEGLLGCLAKGADRAVRVWDEALEGADVLAVARTLAAVVETEAPDLILCGAQSSDSVTGSTGPALAGFLGLPCVAVVTQLQWDAANRTATAHRELEGGLVEVLRVHTPAVLTIQTGINEPRYATLRAIKQARDKPLQTVALGDVGLSSAEVQSVVGSQQVALTTPYRGSGAEILGGSPAEAAERIVEIVQERMSG